MTYSEKLKDPRWQKKRLEILDRDEFKCRICNDSKSTLHVHHKYYEYNKDPWDYTDITYITLCETCHDKAHNQKVVVDVDSTAPKWISYCGSVGYEYCFCCPNCGGENLHQDSKAIYHRKTEDSTTGLRIRVHDQQFIDDDAMESNPSDRRDGMRINFSCETCDAISELQIIQHKGTEYIKFFTSHFDGESRSKDNYW